jgi:pimeloyl-ACP methyl ester carboxylesterase
MELFYNQYGEEGPPLIILHGLLGAHGNWHTLSRTRFSDEATVYALDQRNHGRSPHADRMDYTAMAADAREFIDRHGLDDVILLGHSMGGKTAMQTALSYPDVVDRLIVADMAPKAYEARHEPLLNALARIDPSTYEDRDAIDAALAEDVPSRPIRQFLLKNLDYDGERYTWRMNLDAIRKHYDNMNAALPPDETFEGPTLFIRGGQSDYVDEDDLPDIRTRFPAARLVTIDGAGHWVHADAPTPFADAVLQFLPEESVV